MPIPDPSEVQPWYLRNITQALALDESTGNVYVRTDANISVENANITIGDVGITSLGNVDISGNTLPVTVESGNITVTSISGTTNVDLPATKYDAFNRLRVSNPYTLFDTRSRYYDHNQFANDLSGSGNVTYDANSSTFELDVTSSGDSVIRETEKTFIYQPGKSLLTMHTFAMNTPTVGLTQRVGYYGEDNGVFFEVSGTTYNLVIRSSSSGSLTEERIAQSSWNGDKLNGTGESGYTLYPDRTQIFWIDIEWLGVGSVRCGFVIDGKFIVCHTFHHANQSGNVTTYMSTATLPVRYEISSSSGSGMLRQICSTVISEGGYSLTGIPKTVSHSLSAPRTLNNDETIFTPIISIRLKSANQDAIVLPTSFSIIPAAAALVKYRIYTRAITSGGSWVSAGADSSVEYNLTPTALVSGNENVSGFLVTNNQSSSIPQNEALDFEKQLLRNSFNNTMYEYVITAATTATNLSIFAGIDWQEIT